MVMEIGNLPVIPECFRTDLQLSVFICYIRDGKMKWMGLCEGHRKEQECGDADQPHFSKLHKLLMHIRDNVHIRTLF